MKNIICKRISTTASIAATFITLTACGTWHNSIVSTPTASTLPNFGIDLDGAKLFIYPQNEFILRSSFTPSHVPIVKNNSEGRLSSYYYYEEPGSYSRPIKDPNYFIIEVVVVPSGHVFSLDVTSISLVREQSSPISPSHWYMGGAMVNMTSEDDQGKGGITTHCIPMGGSFDYMKEASIGVVTIDREYPTCIVLKFPIEPILPTEEFSLELASVLIDGHRPSLESLEFGVSNSRYFSGYRLGP